MGDYNPTKIIGHSINQLYNENYLTKKQAIRFEDQIEQVTDFVYSQELLFLSFYIRVNSIQAQISYKTGEIKLIKYNKKNTYSYA